MAHDPEFLAHQEWIGYVQPVGLVVSTPALLNAGVVLNRNVIAEHRRFLEALPVDRHGEPEAKFRSFAAFARAVLDWTGQDLRPAPDELAVPLTEYQDVLRPTHVLVEDRPANPERPWLLLVEELPFGTDLDKAAPRDGTGWDASPQARFERLLREAQVPIGLLVNGQAVRLVYAPRGESSGYVTFRLADMVPVAGRSILSALLMLLSAERLFSVAPEQRLPALLAHSRRYQSEVSTRLAGQVLEALYELLRGFQKANDDTSGALLHDVLRDDPDHVYGGLLTTLLRLVFVLYAEDKGLLSTDPVYVNHYSVSGLFDRLRADVGRHHDTMDQRYGAWAHLLALFRLVYRGGSHAGLRIPAREGYLFDPERYRFLEGRQRRDDAPRVPRVPDGHICRVLEKLLVLNGERLSYRTLDVEQIGSVYEAIMGFRLRVAEGPSIAIRPKKKHGAPATIQLDALLEIKPDDRIKWLKERTDQELAKNSQAALKDARTVEDLLAALDTRIARHITPDVVPHGAMVFQPSDQRRRSGSHYTPRTLTGPIVREALAPVLRQLGSHPTPDQILALKVCDPAMGSGAFLVEACRQLGDALVSAWRHHGRVPSLPPGEDEVLHARRLVAQRCLYGVDKNPLATDLAKLSLWLATLAKDHPFTFVDHCLRSGDSLVGLTRRQIAALDWNPKENRTFIEQEMEKRIRRVNEQRQKILSARDDVSYAHLQEALDRADGALDVPRLIGDAVVAVFLAHDKPKAREKAVKELVPRVEAFVRQPEVEGELDAVVCVLRAGEKGVAPFHWELEFPEVFPLDRPGGFDVIVGNPPFMGKNTLIDGHAEHYLDWLQEIHAPANGNADLVAHFFRRAFTLLREGGCFGLIATNTISQGDTRFTGLRWICTNGGTIYRARKRLKWPGEAAVVVSVVHVGRGAMQPPFALNERAVEQITAFLFHAGGHEDPVRLEANAEKSFQGSIVLGMGFTFDDTDKKGVASPLSTMRELIEKDPRNAERIFPYLGGEEVNDDAEHEHHRHVINFENFPLKRIESERSWAKASEADRREMLRTGMVPLDYSEPVAEDWPELIEIVRQRVKPERDDDNRERLRIIWWQYAERRPGLRRASARVQHVLAVARHSQHIGVARLPSKVIASDGTVVFPIEGNPAFAVLQSRIHEAWARFFGSSMKDDLRYTPSDCFETFPFPADFEADPVLEEAGRTYYEFRAALMVRRNIGLTKLYNEFHQPHPDDPDILQLRALHDAMDRAVLDAYGWTDLQPVCQPIPEFADEDEPEPGQKPKPPKYRYRWPEDFHDEVLARLLALNRERALEEGQLVTTPEPTPAPQPPRARRAAAPDLPLLDESQGDA